MHWAEDLIGRPWVAGGRGPACVRLLGSGALVLA